MRILGADFPVVLLTCAAMVFGLWAWVESIRQARVRRNMAAWLAKHRAGAWAALPWTARRLIPQTGIAALKRQGQTRDPAFESLEIDAVRLGRRALILILLAAATVALVLAGMTFLGWSAG